eukprot:TRINITY_DN4942_c0_g1_i1.p1 TRINITY_DN4942_c0_g1~~TRINITY_DN4942_c0_g1_i1.p1  ORF type:complete len:238 (-),score=5.32 TRINITY_DN4942_c0_g1_i1:186-899(-)
MSSKSQDVDSYQRMNEIIMINQLKDMQDFYNYKNAENIEHFFLRQMIHRLGVVTFISVYLSEELHSFLVQLRKSLIAKSAPPPKSLLQTIPQGRYDLYAFVSVSKKGQGFDGYVDTGVVNIIVDQLLAWHGVFINGGKQVANSKLSFVWIEPLVPDRMYTIKISKGKVEGRRIQMKVRVYDCIEKEYANGLAEVVEVGWTFVEKEHEPESIPQPKLQVTYVFSGAFLLQCEFIYLFV